MQELSRQCSARRAAWIAAPLLALSTAAAAAPVGSGPTYDQNAGDLTTSPALAASSTGIALGRGVLTITGGTGADVASVAATFRGSITAKRGGFTETFAAAEVTKVVFYGNAGDDSFTNGTSIPSETYGGDGNDTLNGGAGADFLVGGYGQDTVRGYGGADVIWGSGGADFLYGGDGDDHVKGHGGNDALYGESGDDALFGGSGNDTLSGGSYQDTLVTIGGGDDTVAGGTSSDFFWVDPTDVISDASATEAAEAYLNQVPAFYSYSYTGGATSSPVAKDLVSYDLADPFPDDWDVYLENFADRPLFASGGPSKDDVFQGGIGDCFILGPLTAVADATPDSIRKLVVDLDDGTYAVRFFRDDGGAPQYVRVDADLWMNDATSNLRYARLGVDDSVWVPIVEKAFAFFRRQDGAYASINGGAGAGSGQVIMGASSNEQYEIAGYGAADLIGWVDAGRPAGPIANHVNTTVPQLLNWIVDRQQEGRPVYTGNISGANNSTSFVADNWRRGQHIVMIDHVDFDGNGNPISLTLRDQNGGVYRTLTDFARIYFLIGRALTYDMP